MSNKIIKFIKDNKLDFESTGSGLNSNCTILSGYALHLDLSFEDLCDELAETPLSRNATEELERVFDYAKDHDYGEYWTSKDAKERYVF